MGEGGKEKGSHPGYLSCSRGLWKNSVSTLSKPTAAAGRRLCSSGSTALRGERPLADRGRSQSRPQLLAPCLHGSGAERARNGAAPRHQVRKRRGPRVARSGQVGFLRPLAKLEKTVGAGAERIQVVIVVSNCLISCILSGESEGDRVPQNLGINGHMASTRAALSV